MRHINATEDPEAREALSGFINQFYQEEEKGTPSFTLVPQRANHRCVHAFWPDKRYSV